MNYVKIYKSLIQKRKKYPAEKEFFYTENHHIIPRSIDKSLEKDPRNLVSLSAREHFIAHALLVKIYKQKGDKDKWYRMLCAFDAMSKLFGSIRYPELRYKNHCNSKLYEIWKIELSNYIKESGCRSKENNPQYGKKIYYNPETKKVKYFKEKEVPNGWLKGTGGLIIPAKGTLNTKWVYNIETNEQRAIKKEEVEQFLKENLNYKIGLPPTSKTHIQQYNPSEGKRWISNISLKEAKRIEKDKALPKGWLEGRLTKEYLEKYEDAIHDHLQFHFIDKENDLKENNLPRILKNKRKPLSENKNYQKYTLSKIESKTDKLKMIKEYFKEYKLNRYQGVNKKFGYEHTSNALCNLFRRYIPEEWNEWKELNK